jgi:hypothetical protein
MIVASQYDSDGLDNLHATAQSQKKKWLPENN